MTDLLDPPETEPTDTEITAPHRRSRIATLATAAARRSRVTLSLLVVVILVGLSAYGFGLDREGFPPIDTPISIVSGTYFVDDAEAVDADVVVALEAAFAEVKGVISTEATARPTSFTVVVEFDGISSDVGTQRLVDIGVPVPDGVQLQYIPVNAAKLVGQYDALVSVVGPEGASPLDLEAQAAIVADALATESSVAVAEVRELVTRSVNPATGEDEERLTRFTRVALDASGYRDAVAIGLIRSDGSDLDVLAFSDLVEDRLADTVLADGYQASITADFAVGVRQQISSLTTNLLTGLAAVAVVSFLLIGWRVALMTAGFMGVVLMGALIGLWTTGSSLNTITLFGLILTLGLLVDDAIVISESIDANRDEPDPHEPTRELGVIRTALERVGSASLAGTLTTVVVFSPMLFIGGILGEFIRPIPSTVIITLLLSFVFSILFIPAVARSFLLGGAGDGAGDRRPSRNPVVRAEKAIGRTVGKLAAYPWRNGWKGRVVGVSLVCVALLTIVSGGRIAGTLGFSIFPAGKDATGLLVTAEFPPGTTIEESQEIADRIDGVVVDVLGDELIRSQYVRGNERVTETFVDLTPIGSRGTTAPEFVEQIDAQIAAFEGSVFDGTRVTVSQLENGPPVLEFPFAMQIDVGDDGSQAVAQQFAVDVRTALVGAEIVSGGETVTIIDAIISTDGQITRIDGDRIIEVRAKYDDDQGLSGLLNETQALVEERFPASDIEARGLAADAVAFDFGLESDNQDDFAALGVAGIVALFLMLLLITVQFRSLAQSLLIFLAIPFSFFGVFSALSATGNPLSFLAAVGFIALIGVAVNNTILLVDAANRQRRQGASAGAAIQYAVTNRFRPLVATTFTTVVGLLPLSLSDPFWESLGFTLMGGLVSSTILVLLCFPAFYLGLESVRTPLRNMVRRRQGRELLT